MEREQAAGSPRPRACSLAAGESTVRILLAPFLALALAVASLASPGAWLAHAASTAALYAAPIASADANERALAPVRLLARFADAHARERALATLSAVPLGEVAGTPFERIEVRATSTQAALRALEDIQGVLGAELDERVSLSFTPNDPLFLTDPYTPQLGQWGTRRAQFEAAWDVQRGQPTLTIAVIDTGVDRDHPDLAAALVTAPRFVSAADPSCGAQGTTNRDDNGHGTHVVGIAGALGDNGEGIAGGAFGVRLMPIKALDCRGSGFVSDIAAAITFAVDNGARVISISLGSSSDTQTLRAAVDNALAQDVVIIAAAGNCGDPDRVGQHPCPTQDVVDYPAGYPGVLAVGSTEPNDTPSTFSTAGPHVGIAAPGSRIVSTFPTYPVKLNEEGVPQQPYASLNGTSLATPLVAAAAALLRLADPALSAQAIVQRLRATADDIAPSGWDPKTGDGRLNAFRALTEQPAQTFGATYAVQDPPARLAQGSTAELVVNVTNTSSFTWIAGGLAPFRLATHWHDQAGAIVIWDGPRADFPHDVPVGTTVTMTLPVIVPERVLGTFVLSVDLVQEGVTWFSQRGVTPARMNVRIDAGYGASYTVAETALSFPNVSDEEPAVAVTVTNTGSLVWPAGGAIRLASHWRDAAGQIVIWDGPRAFMPSEIAAGQNVELVLPLGPPSAPGTYTLEIDMVHDGVTWFSQQDVAPRQLSVTVTSGYGATYQVPAELPTLPPSGRIGVAVTLTNTGAFTWRSVGPVFLAYHVLDAQGDTLVVWDGLRTFLPADVAPGESVELEMQIEAPAAPGDYIVSVDLVREGITWFSQQQVATADIRLRVAAD